MDKNQKNMLTGAAIIVGLFFVGQYIISADQFLRIDYYRDGEKIDVGTLSIVGGVEAVTDITITSILTNDEDPEVQKIPIDCRIIETSPASFIMPGTSIHLVEGQSGEITSSLIPTAPLEGTSPTFYAKAECTGTYGGETMSYTKEGTVIVSDIRADPVIGFSMTLVSSTGETGGGIDPDPMCLTSGSGCSVNSECCSNVCSATTLWLTPGSGIRCPTYEGSCVYSGDCPSADGCTLEAACTSSAPTWVFKQTISEGSYSLTLPAQYTGSGISCTDTTYRIYTTSGTCN